MQFTRLIPQIQFTLQVGYSKAANLGIGEHDPLQGLEKAPKPWSLLLSIIKGYLELEIKTIMVPVVKTWETPL